MIDVNHLVGTTAVLIPSSRNGDRIDINIIGVCRNKTLMVELNNSDFTLSEVVLSASYQLRINYDNIVYNFNTFIEVVHHEPTTYLHLALPDANKLVSERKSPRIPVKSQSMSLSVSSAEGQLKAALADVSLEGARLIARRRLGKIDEIFYIDMLVNNDTSTITLPCKVRYVRTDIQTEGQDSIVFHHGVEFGDLSESTEEFIREFVRASGS